MSSDLPTNRITIGRGWMELRCYTSIPQFLSLYHFAHEELFSMCCSIKISALFDDYVNVAKGISAQLDSWRTFISLFCKE